MKAQNIFSIFAVMLHMSLPPNCHAAPITEDGSPTDSIAATIQKGQFLYSGGQYLKVTQTLHANGYDTLDARASSLAGMSYSAINDYENAFYFLKKACMNDSTNISYRFQLATFFSQCGLMQQAEKEYRVITDLDSTFLPAYVRLGIIYNDQKLFAQAKACFSYVVVNNPRDFLASYYMGTLMATSSERDSAAIFLKRSIQLNGGFVPAIDVLASLLYAQKDYVGALQLYQKASLLRPSTADYLYKIGLCYRQLKDYDTAIVFMKKAVAIDSTNASYFAQLAYCHYFSDQYDSSIFYSLKAISYRRKKLYLLYQSRIMLPKIRFRR